jgi:uncharacterized protein YpbB
VQQWIQYSTVSLPPVERLIISFREKENAWQDATDSILQEKNALQDFIVKGNDKINRSWLFQCLFIFKIHVYNK